MLQLQALTFICVCVNFSFVLPLFFTGVEAVLSKFKCFSLGAPKHELLTIEGGVDEIRNAFFEGKSKSYIKCATMVVRQWIVFMWHQKLYLFPTFQLNSSLRYDHGCPKISINLVIISH